MTVPSQQQFTITLVIALIGLFGLVALSGAVYLLSTGKPAGELGNLASAALGSLATMLATTRTTDKATSGTVAGGAVDES